MSAQVRFNSSSNKGGRDSGKTGASCELFVMADLLRRGFEVTKPLSTTAKHDLHAKIGKEWYGVQVKAGRFNPNSGKIHKNGKAESSPILALVYLPLWKIEYRKGTGQLPKELVTGLENSLQEQEEWLCSCTDAARVKAQHLRDEFTRQEEISSSAQTVGSN